MLGCDSRFARESHPAARSLTHASEAITPKNKKSADRILSTLFLSGRRGSNPRPSAWKADALSTELLPRNLRRKWWAKMDSNHRRHKPADLQSAPFGHSGIRPFLLLRKGNTIFRFCKNYRPFLQKKFNFFRFYILFLPPFDDFYLPLLLNQPR